MWRWLTLVASLALMIGCGDQSRAHDAVPEQTLQAPGVSATQQADGQNPTHDAVPSVTTGGDAIEPADLREGSDPAIAYLVRDTIHDGGSRVPVPTLGVHAELWEVRGGYLLRDWKPRGNELQRLVFVGAGLRAGERHVVARFSQQLSAGVSPQGTRVAWSRGGGELTPTTVSVAVPSSGRVLATRDFRWARVLGVTRTRVLLARRGPDSPTTTVWWNYRHDRVRTIARHEGVRADLAQDRIVLVSGPLTQEVRCNRVAPLSHPMRTLWRSCQWSPFAWSPNGRRVLSTHIDPGAGTNICLTMTADSARHLGRITGRLHWDAVWEDDTRFLTVALGDSGQASIVRCTVGGRCERAGRLWDLGVPTHGFYAPPPVVLAAN